MRGFAGLKLGIWACGCCVLLGALGCGSGGGSTWTWVSGSKAQNQSGSYGMLGVSAAGNAPAARGDAASWTDAAGNFWLFGGNQGSVGTYLLGPGGQETQYFYDFNDLWKFSKGEWTWMGGSQGPTTYQAGVYGVKGTAAASNSPGPRHGSVTWTDAAGNVWLFGGTALDSASKQGYMNDLWKYSAGKWTWMSGDDVVNQSGAYGTKGTAAAGNVPGARADATGWTDAAGSLWLFGGFGYDSTSRACYNIDAAVCPLNDLWKYSGGQWTWVSGADVAAQAGSYGSQGSGAASNTPGAREFATGWVDTTENLWLFGGVGFDSGGAVGDLNDLWKYSDGQWTWVGGGETAGQAGQYGTKGIAVAGNAPNGRYGAQGWTDANGNFWLFGGSSTLHSGNQLEIVTMNDLWRYSGGQWTWVSGSDLTSQTGNYGMLGVAGSGNAPAARWSMSGWRDTTGNLWLFGGTAVGGSGYFNDLWEYQP